MILPRPLLLASFLFLAAARADTPKQNVKLADLPATVRKSVLEQKQQARILRLEKTLQEGKEIYEVQLKSGVVRKTVFIDDDGAVLEIKQPIPLSQVSPAAKKVIESSVQNGKIVTLESVKSASGLIAAYQVRFTRNGTESQLRVGPDGRLVPE
jgi:hypothetical protein